MTKRSRSRDYRAEYRAYYGPPAGQGTPNGIQMLHRKHKASRHDARKVMRKALGVRSLPLGKDVDHKNHKPLDNRTSNLRLMTVKRNRGHCRVHTCY